MAKPLISGRIKEIEETLEKKENQMLAQWQSV